MSVIEFPKSGRPPPKPPGPTTIYVFAPTYEVLGDTPRKLCLGYTKEEAMTRFYEGGLASHVEPRVFTFATSPKWVKFQLVSQLVTLRQIQSLTPIEDEALRRLGEDPYAYGDGPKLPKPKKRRR